MHSSIQTTLYLLRHGKVNGLPALYGHTDIDVTDEINSKIVSELNQLQKNLDSNNITQIVSSPLQRCFKVAEQFAQMNSVPIEKADNFKEMYFGELDGISFDEIRDSEHSEKNWHKLENFWKEPEQHPLPEAELLLHFYQRVAQAWEQLLEKHQGKNILLVCHGGVIRMILSYILNLDHTNKALFSQLTIKNSSITLIKSISIRSDKHSDKQVNVHNNVITISTPLTCISQTPKAFE